MSHGDGARCLLNPDDLNIARDVRGNRGNLAVQRSVPPHLCFNLGSMGFLTPFEYESMKEEVCI